MSTCGDTNDFIIPKGIDFSFRVQILQEDSFLPQSLDLFTSGVLDILDIDTGIDTTIGTALTKITEDTIDAIVLVEEEIELTVATSEAAIYYIDINGTRYSVDYTGGAVTTTVVADALAAVMGVVPQDVSIVHTASTTVITIKNIVGQANIVTYSSNIARTNYIVGVEAVAGYTSTFYNDNGYLEGILTGISTSALNVSRGDAVDSYYIKPGYQGLVQVIFSDASLNKISIICEVFVVNTGVGV